MMLVVAARPAHGQSQTPGQITRFDPSLNVVDSVITQDPAGNIGIGTTTPVSALDVAAGDLNIAGNILKNGTLFLHNFGTTNTFVGQNAGNLAVSGDSNTATGTNALSSNDAGFSNTANGAFALLHNSMGHTNTAIGRSALENNVTGIANTATGRSALLSNTSGSNNTAAGTSALNNSNGDDNSAVGYAALLGNITGNRNTATGTSALQNTNGDDNTAVGFAALGANNTGTGNTAIGAGANVSAGNLQNATAVGTNAVVNASNKIRLGNASVTVIEGQVAYTFTSDKNQKENFRFVDGEAVLRKIGGLNISSWNYVGHDPQQFRHYGPVAQEFFEAFGHDGVGTVGTPTTINSGDMEGILMIAVQALEGENAALKVRIEALETVVKTTHSERR
jgi:hypothetical protein